MIWLKVCCWFATLSIIKDLFNVDICLLFTWTQLTYAWIRTSTIYIQIYAIDCNRAGCATKHFGDRDLIHIKGHSKIFFNEDITLNTIFRFRSGRSIKGIFLISYLKYYCIPLKLSIKANDKHVSVVFYIRGLSEN